MTANLAAVLMAGGAGTRFWPLSTSRRPKQFLNLFGARSLLQESFDRLRGLVPPERILVLTHQDFVPLVREQLPEVPPEQVIGEPCRRDTAAAVALAALLVERLFGEVPTAVLTADHRIAPVSRFQEVLASAVEGACRAPSSLYTFGVPPRYPATGYGYLQRGPALGTLGGVRHFVLGRFQEKPDLETAKRLLAQGDHDWNSGMFVWTAGAIRAELARQLPGHLQALGTALAAWGTEGWSEALRLAFEGLPRLSIDFGVMERAADLRMVEADFEWSDVGGWVALEPFLEALEGGNRARGGLVGLGASGCTVFCEDPQEGVALLGVEDLVVVRAGRRTLVARRERLEELKQLVEGLPPDQR